MALELRLEQRLEQRLELSLELRLEQRQILLEPVLRGIPQEFGNYINIEVDDDVDLLLESLPFLVLHEFSHPLQDTGKLIVPKLYSDCDVNNSDRSALRHNANETGIDRGAMLAGPATGKYGQEEMILSYSKIVERVLRDSMTGSSESIDAMFLARLCAGMTENLKDTADEELAEYQRNLVKQVSGRIEHPKFQQIVEAYRQVYRETKLAEKYVPTEAKGHSKGGFLRLIKG